MRNTKAARSISWAHPSGSSSRWTIVDQIHMSICESNPRSKSSLTRTQPILARSPQNGNEWIELHLTSDLRCRLNSSVILIVNCMYRSDHLFFSPLVPSGQSRQNNAVFIPVSLGSNYADIQTCRPRLKFRCENDFMIVTQVTTGFYSISNYLPPRPRLPPIEYRSFAGVPCRIRRRTDHRRHLPAHRPV